MGWDICALCLDHMTAKAHGQTLIELPLVVLLSAARISLGVINETANNYVNSKWGISKVRARFTALTVPMLPDEGAGLIVIVPRR